MRKSNGAPAQTVDSYLAELPTDVADCLSKIRSAIKKAAPGAEEVISYQIPTYKLFGPLVHFAAFSDHCSFVAVSKTVFEVFEKDLTKYKHTGRTIHFNPDKPLPASLVTKIVKFRLKENEERNTAKVLAKKPKR